MGLWNRAIRCAFIALACTVLGGAGCSDSAGSGTYYGYFWLARTADSRVLFSKTTGLITAEPSFATTVHVTLYSIPEADVTIPNIQTSNTSEATVSPSSLTFTRDDFGVPQTLTITGVDDFVSDGPQTYTVSFGAIQSTDTFYAKYEIPPLTGTNSDEDSAGITVTPVAGLVVTEAATTATFSVVLNSEPVADVVIPLSVNDATEASIDKTSLTFTPANWNTPQIVTVKGVNDDLDDGNQVFTVLVQAATSADPVYNGRDASDVSGTNNDNDTTGVTVTADACGLFTYEEPGAPDTFTVRLAAEPLANVDIAVSSSDTNEALVAPATLTFTAGDWNVAQTVTVTGKDGFGGATDVAYNIVLHPASVGDALYNALGNSTVPGINLHNDTVGVAVRTTCSSLTTTEAGGTGTFYMTLRSNPAAGVVVTANSSAPTEGTVAATYTFTAGDWFVRQLVTVTGVNEFIDDGNQAYNLTFSGVSAGAYNGPLTGLVNLSNTDNDTAGLTITPVSPPLPLTTTEGGGTAQFTVKLNSEPVAGVTIVFTSNDISEGLVTAGGTLNFDNTNWSLAQTVTVTGQPDDPDGNGSTVAYGITVNLAGSTDLVYKALIIGNIAATNNDVP